MPFAAFDLHKKVVEAIILDDDGAPLLRDRFPATGEDILAFAKKHLTKKHHIAIEATTNTWPVVALLEPFAGSVTVSNAMVTRAIAHSKVKTDKNVENRAGGSQSPFARAHTRLQASPVGANPADLPPRASPCRFPFIPPSPTLAPQLSRSTTQSRQLFS